MPPAIHGFSAIAAFSASTDVRAAAILAQHLEFDAQHLIIPTCIQREAVVRNDQSAPLRLAEMVENDDRNIGDPELPRGQQPGVAGDHDTISTDEDRIRPAELRDRRSNLRDLLRTVRARIPDIWNQPIDGPAFDLEISVHFLR
jgi:hypothetical protein